MAIRKLDPFAAYAVESLKTRGPKVMLELLDVLKQRAENDDEGFADAASRLPEAWRAVMLLAWVVSRLDEGAHYPLIVKDLAEVEDRTLILTALREIGEKQIATAMSAAEDLIDDHPDMWSSLGPPEGEELKRLKRKLYVLIGSMAEPFPAAG